MHAHAHIHMHAPRHPHKQTHSCTCMNTHTFTHACSHAMFWHKWYWWLLRKLHDQQHLVICVPLCVPSLLVCLSGTKIGTSALVKSSIWLLHEGKDKGTVLVPLRCFPGVTPIHSLKKKNHGWQSPYMTAVRQCFALFQQGILFKKRLSWKTDIEWMINRHPKRGIGI